MTIDVPDALEVAADAVSRQNPVVTAVDLKLLYGLLQDEKAGKLSLAAIIKGGALKADVKALRREIILLDDMLDDPVEGPKVEALLVSIA